MADMDKLHALGAQTDEAEGELPPTPEQIEQQRQVDEDEVQAMEWGGVAFTIGSALAMLAPELKQVYTQEACLNWGRSVVPVARKYGWTSVSRFPEVTLALSTLGLVVPTVFVIRKRLTEGGDEKAGGPLAAIKAWWRNKRARRAGEVGQQMAGAGHGG